MPQTWRKYEIGVTVVEERDEAKVRDLFTQFRSLLQANGITVTHSISGAPVSGHRNSSEHGRISGRDPVGRAALDRMDAIDGEKRRS